MIRESYQINEQTIALCPAKKWDHDTVVLEEAATYRVRKTPMQLIRDACIANWSTYEGKRQAVIHHTKYRKKVPIPINLEKNIFTFPTHATSDFNCHWIFFHHIAHIQKQQNQTVITFKNNQQLPLQLSHYIFKKQYERTLSCMIEVNGIYR